MQHHRAQQQHPPAHRQPSSLSRQHAKQQDQHQAATTECLAELLVEASRLHQRRLFQQCHRLYPRLQRRVHRGALLVHAAGRIDKRRHARVDGADEVHAMLHGAKHRQR